MPLIPANPRSLIVFTVVLTLLAGGRAWGADLVRWGEGADIVSASRVLSGSSGPGLNPSFRNSPVTSDYYAGDPDPADRSARFSATAFTGSAEAGARADVRVGNDHSPDGSPYDTIQFSIDAGAAVPQAAGGLVLWQKQDAFLSAFDTVAVGYERLAFTLTGNSNTQPLAGGAQLRIVVRDGATAYYVSNELGAFPSGGNGWGSITDAAVHTWHHYDPTVHIGEVGDAAFPGFNDITAIGVLYLVDDAGTRRYFNTHIRLFRVSVAPLVPNRPPFAADDAAASFAGQETRIAVLENDLDPDGDPLRIDSIGAPAVGTARISGREVVYTAPSGFTGVVEFDYTVADPFGASASATIRATVSEPPPVFTHTVCAAIGAARFSWALESTAETIETGDFVDGQPWVVVPPGGLKLIAATPSREHRSGDGNWVEDREFNQIAADIHITVINPPVGDNYEDLVTAEPRLAFERAAFGWDSRGAIRYGAGRRYDPALGWDGVTPLPLRAGDIVTTPKSFTGMRAADGRPYSTVLEAVAVLTVLGEAPPADAFRPGVLRSASRRVAPEFIRFSDLAEDLGDFLIPLPATNLFGEPVDFAAQGIPEEFTAARLTALMPGPLIMNIGFNDSEGAHGHLNNSGATYSADIARLMGDLAVGAQAAWLTPEQRTACRIRFLQRTIDAYEALLAGLCLSHDGGMMTAFGLRLAIAGRMLGHAAMQAMDARVNGLPSWYFLSDYAQVVYLGDPFDPGADAPPGGDPRFIPWNGPDLRLKLQDVPVESATPESVTTPDSFEWPFYRPVRELPNIKFRITAGPGAGEAIYTVVRVEDYLNPTPAFGEFSPQIFGGRLTVKPAWKNGQPGAGSRLEFFPAVRAESNRWTFKSWGIYRPNRYVVLNRDALSLSPKTDYGTNNVGGYLSMVIALHALGAQDRYSGGMDRWMMAISAIPGYGEVVLNDDRSRFAADPVVRPGLLERSLLGGLWKEQVLDPAGVDFRYTGDGLDGLPEAQPGVTGDSVGNGIPDIWELENFGRIGIDPFGDADADGLNHLMEFLAGTDPNDPGSAFRVRMERTNGGCRMVFPTLAGRRYELLGSGDLTAWELWDTLAGDGGQATFEVDFPGQEPVFTRIRIVLSPP